LTQWLRCVKTPPLTKETKNSEEKMNLKKPKLIIAIMAFGLFVTAWSPSVKAQQKSDPNPGIEGETGAPMFIPLLLSYAEERIQVFFHTLDDDELQSSGKSRVVVWIPGKETYTDNQGVLHIGMRTQVVIGEFSLSNKGKLEFVIVEDGVKAEYIIKNLEALDDDKEADLTVNIEMSLMGETMKDSSTGKVRSNGKIAILESLSL